FDALSYVWGSQAKKYPIKLNGRHMYINQNLYSALPFLCLPEGERPGCPVWIDALCINQDDEREKTEQIAIMHQIYRRADRV
ncbi:heterokaryon incompatibility, partial [Setomelanomma holmii]